MPQTHFFENEDSNMVALQLAHSLEKVECDGHDFFDGGTL